MALFRRSSEIPVHFHGRVVMITGGTAGVGRATAIRFARRGARVGLIARDPAGLDETRQELEALGAEVATFADGVIVGSALVATLLDRGREEGLAALRDLTAELAEGVRGRA